MYTFCMKRSCQFFWFVQVEAVCVFFYLFRLIHHHYRAIISGFWALSVAGGGENYSWRKTFGFTCTHADTGRWLENCACDTEEVHDRETYRSSRDREKLQRRRGRELLRELIANDWSFTPERLNPRDLNLPEPKPKQQSYKLNSKRETEKIQPNQQRAKNYRSVSESATFCNSNYLPNN